MNILEFSDELLVSICTYLVDGEDRINISKTCSRFANLMSDRELLRVMNFSKAYHLPFIEINKFLQSGKDHVTELNLTSCCYLKSSDILHLAQKLTNLKHFYVADTKFSMQHLIVLFSEDRQITKLSASWNENQCFRPRLNFSSCVGLAKILSLFMYVTPCDRHANLCGIVRSCVALQELRIISLTCIHARNFFKGVSKDLRALAVSCHVCFEYSESSVTQEVNHISKWSPEWDYFIFDYRGKDVFSSKPWWSSYTDCKIPIKYLNHMQHAKAVCYPEEMAAVTTQNLVCDNLRLASANIFSNSGKARYFEHCYPALQQVRIFSVSHLEMFQRLSLPQLKEVRIPGENNTSSYLDTTVMNKWTKLTKLSLPISILKSPFAITSDVDTASSDQVPSCFQSKRCRVAHDAHTSNYSLRELVDSSPDLQELDIRGCDSSKYPHECDVLVLSPIEADASLRTVALWHNLERLVLREVPIRSGAFLLEVAHFCPKLWSLHLSNLGLNGLCTYIANLVKALSLFKNLKDFRLYQKHLGDITTITNALKDCPNLERLVIVCSANPQQKLKDEAVIDFIQKAERLKFLFLCLDQEMLGAGKSKHLTKALSRLSVSRPSLIVEILDYSRRGCFGSIENEEEWTKYIVNNYTQFESIPGFHLVEMVLQPYRVSAIPLYWESYNLFR